MYVTRASACELISVLGVSVLVRVGGHCGHRLIDRHLMIAWVTALVVSMRWIHPNDE